MNRIESKEEAEFEQIAIDLAPPPFPLPAPPPPLPPSSFRSSINSFGTTATLGGGDAKNYRDFRDWWSGRVGERRVVERIFLWSSIQRREEVEGNGGEKNDRVLSARARAASTKMKGNSGERERER